jgi:hypothetical protein
MYRLRGSVPKVVREKLSLFNPDRPGSTRRDATAVVSALTSARRGQLLRWFLYRRMNWKLPYLHSNNGQTSLPRKSRASEGYGNAEGK